MRQIDPAERHPRRLPDQAVILLVVRDLTEDDGGRLRGGADVAQGLGHGLASLTSDTSILHYAGQTQDRLIVVRQVPR